MEEIESAISYLEDVRIANAELAKNIKDSKIESASSLIFFCDRIDAGIKELYEIFDSDLDFDVGKRIQRVCNVINNSLTLLFENFHKVPKKSRRDDLLNRVFKKYNMFYQIFLVTYLENQRDSSQSSTDWLKELFRKFRGN